MSRKTTYDAGSIAVLEGLEAVRDASRNVYRKRVHKRTEPPDL